jgi:hypothetical protein
MLSRIDHSASAMRRKNGVEGGGSLMLDAVGLRRRRLRLRRPRASVPVLVPVLERVADCTSARARAVAEVMRGEGARYPAYPADEDLEVELEALPSPYVLSLCAGSEWCRGAARGTMSAARYASTRESVFIVGFGSQAGRRKSIDEQGV